MNAPSTRTDLLAVRWIYLRLLGLVSLAAFLSAGAQLEGLVGSRGILPVATTIERFGASLTGVDRWLELPTLFWLGASDAALGFVSGLGALVSLGLVIGVWPRAMLVAAWALYLSIQVAGRSFFAFQWDILLVEVLFASILFAPRGLWRPGLADDAPPSTVSLMLLRLVAFKLMFSSGAVKLLSGDEAWASLRALDYHFETQPLPNALAWYAHQLPEGVKSAGVVATFFVQLVVPFAIFLPRTPRMIAALLLAGHQLVIATTGSYGFFNLLAIVLLVPLVDDALVGRALPVRAAAWLRARGSVSDGVPVQAGLQSWARAIARTRRVAAIGIAASLGLANALVLARTVTRDGSELGESMLDAIAPFRTVNGYGLFAVMTTERDEIILEGSEDGETWEAYELPYKPGDLSRRPGNAIPHMPRLDWQLWFAALGELRGNPWLVLTARRLLEGSAPVRALFAHDPFPGVPPRLVRATLYRYQLTTPEERLATGAWWKRTYVREYLPAQGR